MSSALPSYGRPDPVALPDAQAHSAPDKLAPVAAIEPPRKRVSHEAELLKALQEAITDLRVVGVSGQGANNKFGVPGWDLPPLRQFQYGDFRIELPTTTVIVETESAGGVGNLVKYWPLLRSGVLTKRLLILHVYMLSSDADYIAHRKLWSFLVDRMTEDLVANGVGRPTRWDARLMTYKKGEPLREVTATLQKMLVESGTHHSVALDTLITAGSDSITSPGPSTPS